MSQYINLNSSNPAAMSGWDSKQIYMQRRETVHLSRLCDDDTSDAFLCTTYSRSWDFLSNESSPRIRSFNSKATDKRQNIQIFINSLWIEWMKSRTVPQPDEVKSLMDASFLPVCKLTLHRVPSYITLSQSHNRPADQSLNRAGNEAAIQAAKKLADQALR